MKADEIRALGADEIRTRLEEAREGYFKLRFQLSTGQLKDTARLQRARREVARLATLLKEREAAAAAEGLALPEGHRDGVSEAEGRKA